MAGSVVEERIENEGFLAAFGGSRRRVGPVIRIVYARPARRFGLGIGRCRDGGRRGGWRPGGASLPAPPPVREPGRGAEARAPSRSRPALVPLHDQNPSP